MEDKESHHTPILDDNDPKELIEGRNIDMHFGRIEIFQERTKYVSFCRPLTENEIKYTIKRDQNRKLIKESFEPDHWIGTINPHEDLYLPITYKPTLASSKDVEVFLYEDNDLEIIKITVTGKAVGPRCTSSSKKIVFYKTPQRLTLQGKVEINNDSSASAHFKIDHPNEDIFKIAPTEGIIKPKSYQHIGVQFCPTKTGFFRRQMFCLIWNSDPLVFELLGFYDDLFRDIEEGLKYFPTDQTYGFGSYLNDSLVIRRDVPPFTLSSRYLDFGCLQVNGEISITQVTSLTNHIRTSIFVEWEKGTQIFKVKPEKASIQPNASAQFEIEFIPDENLSIYSETLVAQVYWKVEKIPGKEEPRPTAPLMCTLRAQGHSFPENEGWITHIEIHPEVVYWQPCLPGDKVATTFMLQNKSHLPVIYKLVPPKLSNVIAKPMMGKLRNFEIIAVQLQTEKSRIRTYIEEWKIIINGQEEKKMTVYFHGETSIPTIEIGKQNKINGGNIQQGSQKAIKVQMKNTCYFTINYKFRLNEKSILVIDPMEGVLPENENTKLEITIMGQQCAPQREKFICEMNIIERNGATSGETYETVVELFSECSYSQLCACPSAHNFGCQPFSKKMSFEFEAVNFGDSPVFFQACQCGDNTRDTNFRIRPCFGEVQPKDSKTFVISGILSLVGEQTLYFGYYNRVARDSPMVTGDPTILFTLNYSAEFPTIQFEEISEQNFGTLFGKPHLFQEYLQIPRLNEILKEIVNDQTEEIHLRLPEFEVQDKIFTIVLAATNVTPYDTTVKLKRKKICTCELVEQADAGLTTRKKGFNCPHRNTISMELQDTRFLSKATRFLTIDIQYRIPGATNMCYILELSNHRAIEIYFTIYAIPPGKPRLSFYKEHFKLDLHPIYIGTRVAPVQIFWMYNNTGRLIHFQFDTAEIKYMCKKNGFKVLDILNPKDQILPYSPKALMVNFLPIELKTYYVQIDVQYKHPGERKRFLKFEIEGRGELATRRGTITEQQSKVGKFSGSFPVSLSIECIDIKMLPVWNKRKELIFIKSNVKNKIIQYIWGTVKIDNVIEISAERKYGLLHPKEVHPVVLVIKTFSEPCIASLLLSCEIVNYTDLVTHQITKEKHKEAQNKIENEFTVTGSGKTIQTVNPIKIHPEPETLYTVILFNIRTTHSKDADQNMDPIIQFRQYPNQSLENIPKNLVKSYYPETRQSLSYPEKGKVPLNINFKEQRIFCRILEEAISDVVYSEAFKKYLKIYSKSPLPYYSEFVMDDKQIMSKKMVKTPLSNEDIANFRKTEIEKFFALPKITELSNILQNLIYESITKMVQCYNPELNIKDINYQIENSLYTCKKKTCPCNKGEDT